MPTASLKNMHLDALLILRADIDKRLDDERRELEKQLSRLGSEVHIDGGGQRQVRRRRTHPLKGHKVAPKYRGPAGETWAGRGQRPRWLTALIKQGQKISEFAIEQSGSGRRKRRASKKSRRRRKNKT
jgi:DNA-binding protein H-NS